MVATQTTVSEQVKKIPSTVRPTVNAARRAVKTAAPKAKEIAYQSKPPRSKSAMWKLARYAMGEEYVVGIGAFSTYAALFFYRGRELDDATGLLHRGRELDDATGLLQGSGKDARFTRLRSPADAERPALKRLVRNAFALASARRE